MKVPVAARRRRLEPPTADKPPTPAVESARVWKAPGHHPPASPDLPTPVGNPCPPTHRPRDFHSYTQPRRRGVHISAGGEEKA